MRLYLFKQSRNSKNNKNYNKYEIELNKIQSAIKCNNAHFFRFCAKNTSLSTASLILERNSILYLHRPHRTIRRRWGGLVARDRNTFPAPRRILRCGTVVYAGAAYRPITVLHRRGRTGVFYGAAYTKKESYIFMNHVFINIIIMYSTLHYQCCSTRVRDSDSSPTRELNLETRDLTRTRALGTRELRRGLDFLKCH